MSLVDLPNELVKHIVLVQSHQGTKCRMARSLFLVSKRLHSVLLSLDFKCMEPIMFRRPLCRAACYVLYDWKTINVKIVLGKLQNTRHDIWFEAKLKWLLEKKCCVKENIKFPQYGNIFQQN